MIPHYSVTIVGAGPTGLALANLLGMAGIRTLLVEQNAATVGEPRAVSIDDDAGPWSRYTLDTRDTTLIDRQVSSARGLRQRQLERLRQDSVHPGL